VTAREQEAAALAKAQQRARDARKAVAATPKSEKGTGRVPARLRVKAPEPTIVIQADLGSIVVNGKRLYGNRAQRRAQRG